MSGFREEYAESDDEIPRVMVGVGYNLAQTTGQAIAAAGSTEPDAVRSALDEEEFSTVIGDFSFDKYGMPEPDQLSAASAQWRDGEQVLVYPQTDEASEMQYPIDG
jgi:branched-chain amino acid transport system substrate-binding protein